MNIPFVTACPKCKAGFDGWLPDDEYVCMNCMVSRLNESGVGVKLDTSDVPDGYCAITLTGPDK